MTFNIYIIQILKEIHAQKNEIIISDTNNYFL
jgi:hypothetical protein